MADNHRGLAVATTTVIIPSWNRASLLPRAVASARAAGSDIEIIVVDNASTDATKEICAGLAGVRYLRLDKNEGPSGARNAGIAASRGDYLAFLDDDDILLPGSVDQQIGRLDAHPEAGFCYGHVLLGDPNCVPSDLVYWNDGTVKRLPRQLPSGDIFTRLISENPIMIHSAVIRRQCVDSVGSFDLRLDRGEDWDFWVRVSEKYPAVTLEAPVAVVRIAEYGSGQLSADRRAMHMETLRLQRQWLNRAKAQALPKRTRRQLYRRFKANSAWVLASSAVNEFKRGSIRSSAYYFGGAFAISPSSAAKRILHAVAMFAAHTLRLVVNR